MRLSIGLRGLLNPYLGVIGLITRVYDRHKLRVRRTAYMALNSHPIQTSRTTGNPEMTMPSHPAVSMPNSPVMAGRYSKPTTPAASSTISTFSSLSMTERNKHDSFNMSGSVFLITSDGNIVSLPIPSENSRDPLNWTWQKRAIALSTVGIFSYSALILTQGASVVSSRLARELPPNVCCNFSHLFDCVSMLMHSDFLD
jgi:hypothetical protein